MANVNKVVGAVKSGIVKRLKKLGLSGAALAKATSAVYGSAAETESNLKLSAAMRKVLMEHVHKSGPVVITGRTSLKIFSLKAYESMRIASRASAKKNAPWLHAAKNKVTEAK